MAALSTERASHLAVRSLDDAGRARRQARDLARRQGLGAADVECVALAVSELATNLARYAQRGEIVLSGVAGPRGAGIQVESRDEGPGIADLQRALEEGYSTSGGLGSGLPGARRLMDEFEIASGPDGTRIVAIKWTTRA